MKLLILTAFTIIASCCTVSAQMNLYKWYQGCATEPTEQSSREERIEWKNCNEVFIRANLERQEAVNLRKVQHQTVIAKELSLDWESFSDYRIMLDGINYCFKYDIDISGKAECEVAAFGKYLNLQNEQLKENFSHVFSTFYKRLKIEKEYKGDKFPSCERVNSRQPGGSLRKEYFSKCVFDKSINLQTFSIYSRFAEREMLLIDDLMDKVRYDCLGVNRTQFARFVASNGGVSILDRFKGLEESLDDFVRKSKNIDNRCTFTGNTG